MSGISADATTEDNPEWGTIKTLGGDWNWNLFFSKK